MLIPFLFLIVSLFIYTVFYFRINRVIILSLKIFTSLMFLAMGILAARNKNVDYSFWIVLGLSAGVVGDILLGFQRVDRKRKGIYFLFGLFAFLLGHCFYIVAFSKLLRFETFVLIVPIVLTLLTSPFLNKAKIRPLLAKYTVFIYALASALLLTIALRNAIVNMSYLSTIGVFAIISFISSDILLFLLYFRNPKRYLRMIKYANIILYYLAQTLLAVSIYLS